MRGWKGIAENGQLIFRWVIQIAWRAGGGNDGGRFANFGRPAPPGALALPFAFHFRQAEMAIFADLSSEVTALITAYYLVQD